MRSSSLRPPRPLPLSEPVYGSFWRSCLQGSTTLSCAVKSQYVGTLFFSGSLETTPTSRPRAPGPPRRGGGGRSCRARSPAGRGGRPRGSVHPSGPPRLLPAGGRSPVPTLSYKSTFGRFSTLVLLGSGTPVFIGDCTGSSLSQELRRCFVRRGA